MQSISDNQKRTRGRPATGSDPMWGIRFSPDQRAQIEHYAATNKVARAEAVRQLVARGLDAEGGIK